jgi:hypothetical protein
MTNADAPMGQTQLPGPEDDRATIFNIFRYTALLFIFPAAALVNYAWIAIDAFPYLGAASFMALLFTFLVVEATSSTFWLDTKITRFTEEDNDPEKLQREKRQAFRIGTIDILRVFFLFMLYVSLFKFIGNASPNMHRLTFLFFGLFLLFNFVWNRQVESVREGTDVIKKYMNSIQVVDHGTFDVGRDLYRRLVTWIYWLQLGLFVVIFPALSIYITTLIFLESIFTWWNWDARIFAAGLDIAGLGSIITVLGIQIVAKMLQAWVLSHVRDAAASRSISSGGTNERR